MKGKSPRPWTAGRATAGAILFAAAAAAVAQTRVLDDFETLSGWRAAPADGVSLTLLSDVGFSGRSMRMDYDFRGHAGWAIARKPLPMDFPSNWEFSFRLSGTARTQTVEFKLLDPSGENVWWSVRRDLSITPEWRRIVIKKRHVSFAWGPAGGGEPTRLGSLEIAITASEGGAGSVWIDDLTFAPLPADSAYMGTPLAAASSSAGGAPPAMALDGDPATSWRSAPAAEPQWLQADFGVRRELGGLVVDWDGEHAPRAFEVQTSEDGAVWTTAWRLNAAQGTRSYVALPECDTRWLRLRLEAGDRGDVGVREISVMPPPFAATPTDFLRNVAAGAPRGRYPRGMLGEMTAWALVGGSPGGARRGLLSADGAFEPGPKSYSIEPFVWLDGTLVTWADVAATQSLLDGHLPIPTVTWTHPAFALEVTAFVPWPEEVSLVRYRLSNRSGRTIAPRLLLAVRPFQVNPPSQFLNTPGGAAEVGNVAWIGSTFEVGATRIAPLTEPDAAGAVAFDAGDVVTLLARGGFPPSATIADPSSLGSGVLRFDGALPTGASREVWLEVLPAAMPIPMPKHDGAAEAPAHLAAAAADWRKRLARVEIAVPAAGRELLDTLRANEAFMLVNRDGPAFQPGSRSYRRSWIRDGAMMAAALLRLGHGEDVKAYARWYAGFQYDDGKTPCCVDHRGADPVPENDADGQFIYLVAETTRLTGDRAFAEELWPRVERAAAHIDALRATRRTDAFRTPEMKVFFGLLPESISHEGYSAKPMHSYWDDFWAMRGLADAVELAGLLGRSGEATRLAASRDELKADVAASIALAMQRHGIDYVPGCAELGDFDATSTTVALAPTAVDAALPRAAVERTFERYWENFVARRDGGKGWENYTPYEMRTVGSFVRLGWRDRAWQLLDYFMRDRMPRGWRQWPEIVWNDRTGARFLGDLPHTWVGSDFARSFLDMLAWERERDQALVLMSGIPAQWLEEGVSVRGMRTRWGALNCSLRTVGGIARVEIGAGLHVPPGGLALRLPLAAPPRVVRIDGRPTPLSGEEIVVRAVPALVEVAH